jgi:predicted nucleic acid-binding protein
MTRFVIDAGVALKLAVETNAIATGHQLLAPTLLRTEVLAALYVQARAGKITKKDAGLRLDQLRRLRIRLLGDRVLQARAWTIAEQLGWSSTEQAEYLALTQLQADAFVTGDKSLASEARKVVAVAPFTALFS